MRSRACCTSPCVGVVTLVVVAAGVAISVLLFGPTPVDPRPSSRPPARRSPWPAAATSTATPSTRRVFMRPGQQLTAGLARLDDHGIDGTVNGTARGDRRLLRPAAPGAERLRPLVRPDHDGRRRRRRRRHRPRPAGLREGA